MKYTCGTPKAACFTQKSGLGTVPGLFLVGLADTTCLDSLLCRHLGGGMETKMTGAEILVACLKEQGVDTIFGYPGGSVLAVYDALGRDGTVRLVTNCHEQFALPRCGRLCACDRPHRRRTRDQRPGATNLVTGIANAYMDSTPLIAITGNVALEQLGARFVSGKSTSPA